MIFGKVIAVATAAGLLALASTATVHAADKKKAAAASEGGPSRQETIEFIQRRGAEFGRFTETFTPEVETAFKFPTTESNEISFTVSDGNLAIKEQHRRLIDRSGSNYDNKLVVWDIDEIAQMPLASLSAKVGWNPHPYSRASCLLKLECAGGTECINGKKTDFFNNGYRFKDREFRSSATVLSFSKHDECKRMAKAFSHLIRLSGGKKEKDAF